MYLCYIILLTCIASISGLPTEAINNVKNNTHKIIGGNAIDITYHPYAASLQVNKTHVCGASIIGRRHLLTSAGCIIKNQDNWKYLYVRLGSTRVDSGGQYIKVKQFFWHELYHPDVSHEYDIAIIVLDQDIFITEFSQVVNLPRENQSPPFNKRATIVGWGADSKSSVVQLKGAVVPIWHHRDCAKVLDNYKQLTMLCAGEAEKAAAKEDIGGSLVYANILYGVASFTTGCQPECEPTVFTNVASVRSFITEFSGI